MESRCVGSLHDWDITFYCLRHLLNCVQQIGPFNNRSVRAVLLSENDTEVVEL
jgi:hypothetical protein